MRVTVKRLLKDVVDLILSLTKGSECVKPRWDGETEVEDGTIA